MKNANHLLQRLKDTHGAVLVFTALIIFILLGVAAFAIDFSYRHVVRNELQNAADAAALSATRELGVIYQGLSYQEQQTYICDPSTIIPIAQQTALENYAGDVDGLTINSQDIVIGTWDFEAEPDTDPLTPTVIKPNAVRVIARRDGGANGPITTFFAGLFNIDTLGITALATAALSGQSIAEPGEIELPIGISRYWFDNNSCNDVIAFSPSNDPASCAGWHAFTSGANNNNLRSIAQGDLDNPQTIAGQTAYNFTGGNLSNPLFDDVLTAFQNKGYDISAADTPILDINGNPMTDATGSGKEKPLCESTNGGLTECSALDSNGTLARYPDGTARNLHEWPTTVPVYDRDDCSNPNQSITVVGFARVIVNDVVGAPEKIVRARVLCDYVEADVRGGGTNFGTFGGVPGLVQ